MRNLFGVVSVCILIVIPLALQANTITTSVDSTVEAWQDSGLYVTAGQTLDVFASGVVTGWVGNPDGWKDPDGLGIGSSIPNGPESDGFCNTANAFSLVGQVGGVPLPEGAHGMGAGFVGSNYHQIIPTSGELYFAFNDERGFFYDNAGAYSVTASVPEPSTFALLGVGGISLLAYAWRRKWRAA